MVFRRVFVLLLAFWLWCMVFVDGVPSVMRAFLATCASVMLLDLVHPSPERLDDDDPEGVDWR